MVKVPVTVKVQAELPIDDVACEVLNHLTSYNLADEFNKRFSGRFTPEQIRRALGDLHHQTAIILRARKAALAAAANAVA
jgi:hypothetical protein